MRSPFTHLPESLIAQAVVDGWGIDVRDLRYAPVGAGAYHWVAQDERGRRWFVTCDDLHTKPWLGARPDDVFRGLVAAYETARTLCDAGASFVVAPLVGASGVVRRLDDRHSVSVFEHVEGRAGEWGQPTTEPTPTIAMLASLHSSEPPPGVATRAGFDLPGRHDLERVMDDVSRPWHGGPLSEPARVLLRDHEVPVRRWLGDLDAAADRALIAADLVVSHGEPHPGNLVHSSDGLRLVDWDTVALAPPERDLWMFTEDAAALAAYSRRTSCQLDPDRLRAYRLLWALSDLVSYGARLRDEHEADADAHRALAALRGICTGEEPAPYGR